MRSAQASPVGQRLIPADEPQFLRGWALRVMAPAQGPPRITCKGEAKVMAPFRLGGMSGHFGFVHTFSGGTPAGGCRMKWLGPCDARRTALWRKPEPPEGMAGHGFASVGEARLAFEDKLPWMPEGSSAAACRTGELRIRQRRLTRNSPPITINAPSAWKPCNCSPSSAQARAAE